MALLRALLSLLFVQFSFSYKYSYAKYIYEEKYINVPIDHFSFTDTRTFSLRYCINASYWEPKHGPIFFYIGNEGPIESFLQHSGFVWEAALKFKALIVFAEHRFYGKSMPFGNLSYTDRTYYSYLTSQQALVDYVDVIYHVRGQETPGMKKKFPNPVIAFGGSYGGMLAAWMRMKYPAIIEGALASSAPIWYFSSMVPCDSFHKYLTSVYRAQNRNCAQNIRKFWDILYHLTSSKRGRRWVSKTWALCTSLTSTRDTDQLRYLLEEMFSAVGMVNYPYPTNFLRPLPANPIKAMCNHLSQFNMKGKALVRSMFKVASVYFNYTGNTEKCLNWKNSSAYDDSMIIGWNIQTCLDMVMPFCSNGKTDMFLPSNWTFKEHDHWCYSTYKLHPIENMAEKLYGGRNLDGASNIIFSNGKLDPWTCGGVTRYRSASVISVLLPNAAHHLDLRAEHKKDPRIVKNARKLYVKLFKQWIQNYYRKHHVDLPNSAYNIYLDSIPNIIQ